jgi:hypothetical protein
VEYDIVFFKNENIREEFAMDEHYIGHVHNRLALSFHMVANCHEGYMVLVHAGDEEHPQANMVGESIVFT